MYMHKSVGLIMHSGYCRKNCRIKFVYVVHQSVRLEVYWAIVTYSKTFSIYGMCNTVHLSVRLKMHWAIVNHMISDWTIIHNMSVGLRMYLFDIELVVKKEILRMFVYTGWVHNMAIAK